MPAEGKVIHRSKQVSRLLAGLLLGIALVALLGGAFLGSGLVSAIPAATGLAGLGFALFFGFLGLTMSVLRTVVTSEEVRVQYGLWGPRIAVAAIQSCKLIRYDPIELGGWGLKYRNGTWAYTMPGHPDVVELVWDDGGKSKRTLISSNDPAALARSIQQARGVRIDIGVAEEPLAEDAAAEQAALAAEEAAAAERTVR